MNFYTLKCSQYTEELCQLEVEVLFNQKVDKKYFFSDRLIDPSRSPFLKERLGIIYEGDTVQSLVEQVLADGFAADDFKVIYQKYDDREETYQERLRSEWELGMAISGEADIHHPKVIFAVTCVNGRWYFGTYARNDYQWHQHDKKPHTYCNSINFRVARALVNIGVGIDTSQTLVDPCCGVGTVLIEALSMGIDAKGFEINPPVGGRAMQNLAFFHYPAVVTIGDMHTIQDHFDVSIIDIPYGLYQPVTAEEQQAIIQTARRICDRLVLVAFENMDEMIRKAGFAVKNQVEVSKVKFDRFVYICE